MEPRADARLRIPVWAAAVAALMAAVPWYAAAQESSAPAAESTSAPPTSAGTEGAALTPAQQLVRADEQLTKMKASALSIRNQLERVRREGDSLKSVCLDDKLSQANVAVRSAQDRRASLASAAERDDAEAAASQGAMMQVLAERSEGIVAEANLCVGAAKGAPPTDDSLVRVDDGISMGELGGNPIAATPPPHLSDPPQCASCWR